MGKHILQTQKLCPGNKNVFDPRQKQFLFPSSKICFRNICFPPGWTSKHLPPQQCFRNNASATMFPSLARPLRILLMFLRPNFLLLWFFRSKQTSAYLLKVCSKKLLCLVTWPALAHVVGVDGRWPSRWMARMYRPFFLYCQLSLPLARFKLGVWHTCIIQMSLFCTWLASQVCLIHQGDSIYYNVW